ncbi:dihydrofolate reductase family protein [Dietzia sp.]|uniref:dihydrofolate reductase family protein n=1 Tax=Dietzia sp. TaxID=1871616 RepID=UPI002FD8B786
MAHAGFGESDGAAESPSRNGTVFYDTATTLDGYLADEQNSLSWLFEVPTDGLPGTGEGAGSEAEAEDPWAHSPVGRADVVVSGSTTYEWVLAEEQVRRNPEKWAEFFGDRPYYVFSSRDLWTPPGHDVRVVRGGVAKNLPGILSEAAGRSTGPGGSGVAGGSVWLVGGGDLVGQFFDSRALDRVEVSVAPATLGAGAPLLPRRIGSAQLTLDKVERQGKFARLEYAVAYPEGKDPSASGERRPG